MSEARTITMEMVRKTLRRHCKSGVMVSNAELYRMLDLKCEKEKDRLRTRLNGMVNQGELLRVGSGRYEYNFKFILRKSPVFSFIWRFVRMEKEAWSFTDVCQLLGVSYAPTKRYCERLEKEGYIVRYGKRGPVTIYRGTKKANDTPETPCLDVTDNNPFERENIAATELAHLMLCHDLNNATTVHKIVVACNVLRARFDKSFNQNENEGARV